jgi:hypothetical protein
MRFLAYSLCTIAMTGFFILVRYVFEHTSDGFGAGLFVGAFTMAILFWGAERVQRSRH